VDPTDLCAIWQFFIARGGGGGPQGVLSIGKSKAKVYVKVTQAKLTLMSLVERGKDRVGDCRFPQESRVALLKLGADSKGG